MMANKQEIMARNNEIWSDQATYDSGSSSKLLAWCSSKNNNISIIDIETKEKYVKFDGCCKVHEDSSTRLKEIPNTKYLVSLHHCFDTSANMEIYDVSHKGKARKIYSYEEVIGGAGQGDVAYNSRRSLLGAIPLEGKTTYHLFNIDTYASKMSEVVKLYRKSAWHSHYRASKKNHITGVDFNPGGKLAATIDRFGTCLISELNTNSYCFHLDLDKWDWTGCCRWSINEPLLFVKYDSNSFNLLDIEKQTFILRDLTALAQSEATVFWIDACSSNRNLLAAGGQDKAIQIFDKREGRIVKTLTNIHNS